MSYFILALNAYLLKRKWNRYQREKENSIKIDKGEVPVYTFADKYHHFCSRTRRNIFRACFRLSGLHLLVKIFSLSPDNRVRKFCTKLYLNGTFENYILKSIVGFIAGISLTYVFFAFFSIQLGFTVSSATAWCSLFGLILTLGLAFSTKIRCYVFLLLPLLFSKRGRQGVMAYTLVLVLSGPAKNTMDNMNILSQSMACGQEILKHVLKQILEAIKKPFLAIKEAFRKVMKTIKAFIDKLKTVLLVIKKIIIIIAKVIKTVYQWLKSILNICNKKMGTPYERCLRVFDNAVVDCQATLGPMFNWLCSIVYLAKVVCVIAKIIDLICMLVEFIKTTVVGTIKRKIMEFVRHIKSIFYIRIKFDRDYEMDTSSSKSYTEIGAEIVAELKERMSSFIVVFQWMGVLMSLLFLQIVFKVWMYEYRFMTTERFDNLYITNEFIEMDIRRAAKDMETVLPLSRLERRKYTMVRSIRLMPGEKLKLTKSAFLLFMASFKMFTFLAMDYSLYWLMMLIRKHGRFKTVVKAPNMIDVNIEGQGILADLFRIVVKAFKPFGIKLDVDTTECLPDPLEPDLTAYLQILSLIALCWILMILEPYGLRQRSVIMGYYYPERAKQRSVWLYNRILRSRSSFLKFARRQLRRMFTKGGAGIEKVTFLEQLQAMSPAFLASLLGKLFGSQRNKACLLCAHVVREGQGEILVCCPKPDCAGQFCQKCFSDLDNLCTVCLEPVQYGDTSDVSIEKESSDEDDLRTPNRLDPELGFEEGDPLNYDYQEDYQNDSNEGKLLLLQVSSNTGLLTVRPTLSSTQIFNEPLPEDFEVRRTRTLELMESEDDDITFETGSVMPEGKPNRKKHSKDVPGIFKRFFRFLFQLCCQGKVQDEETARPLLSESPDEVSEDDSGSGPETIVSSDGHPHLATIENNPSERSTSLISVTPTLSPKVSTIFKHITSSKNDPMSSTSTDTPRTVVITKSKRHRPEKPISTLQLPVGSHLPTSQINLNVPSPPSAPSPPPYYPPSAIILPSSRKQALGSTFPSSPPKNKPGDSESRTKPKVKRMTSPRDETVRWVAAPKLVLQAGILKRSRGTYYGQSEGSSSSLSVFEQPRIGKDLNKMYTNDSEGLLKHELGELKQFPVIKRTEEWVEMSRQMLRHGVSSTDEGFETHPGPSREFSDDLATSWRSSVDVSYDESSSDIGRLAPIDTYFKSYSTNPDISLCKQDSNDDTLSEVSSTTLEKQLAPQNKSQIHQAKMKLARDVKTPTTLKQPSTLSLMFTNIQTFFSRNMRKSSYERLGKQSPQTLLKSIKERKIWSEKFCRSDSTMKEPILEVETEDGQSEDIVSQSELTDAESLSSQVAKEHTTCNKKTSLCSVGVDEPDSPSTRNEVETEEAESFLKLLDKVTRVASLETVSLPLVEDSWQASGQRKISKSFDENYKNTIDKPKSSTSDQHLVMSADTFLIENRVETSVPTSELESVSSQKNKEISSQIMSVLSLPEPLEYGANYHNVESTIEDVKSLEEEENSDTDGDQQSTFNQVLSETRIREIQCVANQRHDISQPSSLSNSPTPWPYLPSNTRTYTEYSLNSFENRQKPDLTCSERFRQTSLEKLLYTRRIHPLYNYNELAYQSHDAYSDLVDELKVQLQKRKPCDETSGLSKKTQNEVLKEEIKPEHAAMLHTSFKVTPPKIKYLDESSSDSSSENVSSHLNIHTGDSTQTTSGCKQASSHIQQQSFHTHSFVQEPLNSNKIFFQQRLDSINTLFKRASTSSQRLFQRPTVPKLMTSIHETSTSLRSTFSVSSLDEPEYHHTHLTTDEFCIHHGQSLMQQSNMPSFQREQPFSQYYSNDLVVQDTENSRNDPHLQDRRHFKNVPYFQDNVNHQSDANFQDRENNKDDYHFQIRENDKNDYHFQDRVSVQDDPDLQDRENSFLEEREITRYLEGRETIQHISHFQDRKTSQTDPHFQDKDNDQHTPHLQGGDNLEERGGDHILSSLHRGATQRGQIYDTPYGHINTTNENSELLVETFERPAELSCTMCHSTATSTISFLRDPSDSPHIRYSGKDSKVMFVVTPRQEYLSRRRGQTYSRSQRSPRILDSMVTSLSVVQEEEGEDIEESCD